MRFRIEDIINKPVTFLPAIIRELDRLPGRIQRTIKILRAEIAQREAFIGHGENVEIEPIPDPPKLPARPPEEFYHGVLTPNGIVAADRLPSHASASPKEAASVKLAKDIVNDFIAKMHAKRTNPPEQKS